MHVYLTQPENPIYTYRVIHSFPNQMRCWGTIIDSQKLKGPTWFMERQYFKLLFFWTFIMIITYKQNTDTLVATQHFPRGHRKIVRKHYPLTFSILILEHLRLALRRNGRIITFLHILLWQKWSVIEIKVNVDKCTSNWVWSEMKYY